MPSVLLLDLDDTILDDTGRSDECWRIACSDAASARRGLNPQAIQRQIKLAGDLFWSNSDQRDSRLRMREAWGRIATAALAALGIDDPALGRLISRRHFELRDLVLKPLPGAIEALRRIRSQGLRLGLVTNGGSETQREKIERFALAPYFEYIGIEGEVGFGKPDRAAYETALQRLAASAEETWMVGNSLERDVAGAQAAGISGVWLDRNQCRRTVDTPRADRVVRSLMELA
jgi:putative hydrolase of the HAD superfamily